MILALAVNMVAAALERHFEPIDSSRVIRIEFGFEVRPHWSCDRLMWYRMEVAP